MASVNKVILVGNLGADPETRYMPNGDAVCNIRLATTESWKDKASGERKEITEWHRVVFYRRLAEIVEKYLKKGSAVYIEGRIRTRKWQDKEGQDRYSTEIHADNMLMLGGRPQNEGYGAQPQTYYQPAPQANPPRQAPPPAQPRPNYPASAPQHFQSPPPGLDFDDDIPF